MKNQMDSAVEAFLNNNQITPGLIPVPVDLIVKRVQESNPIIPVTKAAIGRRLTKSFVKKQQYGTWGEVSGLCQCYFLNKSI